MSPSSRSDAGGTKEKLRAYLAALPPESRRILKKVRETIRAAVPDAVDHFSYGMPGFKLDGRPLIWYAAWREHFSLYPMTEAIRLANAKELAGYEMSKGTIRFPWTKPPSSALVRRLARGRAARVKEVVGARRPAAKGRGGRQARAR